MSDTSTGVPAALLSTTGIENPSDRDGTIVTIASRRARRNASSLR
jgi:hypothetical protein